LNGIVNERRTGGTGSECDREKGVGVVERGLWPCAWRQDAKTKTNEKDKRKQDKSSATEEKLRKRQALHIKKKTKRRVTHVGWQFGGEDGGGGCGRRDERKEDKAKMIVVL
jgi:hypothetical protein